MLLSVITVIFQGGQSLDHIKFPGG